MARHWLDSSVFITAKNSMYAFDIHVTFWAWVNEALKQKLVGAPRQVYAEVVENVRVEDALGRWWKSRVAGNRQTATRSACAHTGRV
jgi:hypothetical protein